MNRKKQRPIWCYYNPETLEYKHARWFKPFMFVMITLIVISTFMMGWASGSTNAENNIMSQDAVIQDGEIIPLIIKKDKGLATKRKVYDMLVEMNVRFPHIVFAQMCVESGHLGSVMFKNSNNMFGMKRTEKRINMQDYDYVNGNGDVFGGFDKWEHSVIDYALYQARYLHELETEEEYYLYLDRVYAESDTYLTKVRSIANNIDKYLDD